MDTVYLIIGIAIVLLLLLVIYRLFSSGSSKAEEMVRRLADTVSESNGELRHEVGRSVQESVKNLGDMIGSNQKLSQEAQTARMDDMTRAMSEQLKVLENRFATLEQSNSQKMENMRTAMTGQLTAIREDNGRQLEFISKSVNEKLENKMNESSKVLNDRLGDMSKSTSEQLKVLENRFATLEQSNAQKMEAMRTAMTGQLTAIREDNGKQLESIRQTVNEKLENKMNESFKLVSDRLEQVYKGLGEMQTVAASVGDLKKVLSNVKTRGTFGEIQLGAILSELLAPEQYLTDTKIDPRSKARVEFAVKLPGGDDGSTVLLPIDSKFPGDKFAALQDAYETGSQEEIAAAKKQLLEFIRSSGKEIHDKYIVPPYSTNFAILFLPFEGLYAEVVNSGMVDQLRREFNVSITGPSTMAALLNSLQMGFRTLAIQKRSTEVWTLLGSVKTEFGKFAKVLESTQKQLRDADSNLEKLVGVRTRKINDQLIAVEALPQMTESVLPDENLIDS